LSDTFALYAKHLVGIRVISDHSFEASAIKLAVLDDDVTSPPVDTTWTTPTVVSGVTQTTIGGVTTWSCDASITRGPAGTLTIGVGRWRVWAQITDTPEVELIACPIPFAVV
jgi:hypothetical protein